MSCQSQVMPIKLELLSLAVGICRAILMNRRDYMCSVHSNTCSIYRYSYSIAKYGHDSLFKMYVVPQESNLLAMPYHNNISIVSYNDLSYCMHIPKQIHSSTEWASVTLLAQLLETLVHPPRNEMKLCAPSEKLITGHANQAGATVPCCGNLSCHPYEPKSLHVQCALKHLS